MDSPTPGESTGWQWAKRLVHPVGTGVAVVAGAAWLIAYNPAFVKPPAATPPAKVEKVVKEGELATVTLSEEAEKKLGLQLGAVTLKSARRVRVYGGDVTVPVGKTILASAPLSGTLRAPEGGLPKVGAPVKKGQVVFQLLPLFSPEARTQLATNLITAQEAVNAAQVQIDATQKPFERAKRLLKEGTGSQRQVEDAQAPFDAAQQALKSATNQKAALAKELGDAQNGTAAPIALEATEDGLLRNVNALPGQFVPAGAALFEVVDLTTVWVRVALPVGDLGEVARADPARVGKPGVAHESKAQTAKPVVAPPSANPLAMTVDFFYELPNPDGLLVPGQRVEVQLPLAESRESATLPRAAVATDIHGGTWVYEPTAARTFVRRRVVVGHVTADDVVLSAGPPVGTRVVVEGAQGLFGAETGFVK